MGRCIWAWVKLADVRCSCSRTVNSLYGWIDTIAPRHFEALQEGMARQLQAIARPNCAGPAGKEGVWLFLLTETATFPSRYLVVVLPVGRRTHREHSPPS